MRFPKIVAAMLLFAACTDVSSTNIRTGGMTAHIHVTAVGNGEEALTNQKVPRSVEKHIKMYFDQINKGK